MANNESGKNESASEIPYLFYKSGSRKPAKYFVDGKPYTAKSALEKFPRLIGLLQPNGRIKRKSVEDKFRRYFRKGKFKDEDFNVEAPEFLESKRALDGAFREFICDDPMIGGYDLPSVFNLLAENIKKTMRENTGTKVYLNLVARMRMLNDGREDTHTFYSGEFEIFPGTDLDDVIEKMKKNIFEKFEKMETAVGSGWALIKIQNLKLHFAEFKPMKGSSFVDLPDWIKKKKAVINILNKNDNECFKWCVTRAMNPLGKRKKENLLTKKLREQSKIFDWTGVNFPTSFEDIGRFEKNNLISVKVLGCDDSRREIVHLRNGNGRYKLAVTLLLFEEHYCLVRNVSRLASRQSRDGITYFCDFCSFSNRAKEKVLKHQGSCSGEVLEPERVFPEPGTFLKFKNCERSAEQPFVIYAVFESRLKPMFEKKGGGTTQYQEHVPIGYAYYLVCRFDATENIFRSHTARSDNEDIGLHFIKSLRDTVLDLWMKFKHSKAMRFTIEDEIDFREAKKCWICGKNFSFMEKYEEKVVRDHCHYTGKYRGAAHNSCNLRLRRTKRIPVIFHNFTGYDNHLFVKSLGKIEGEISVIARNEEKHVSVTKDIPVDVDQRWQLRFSDSSSFMCGSLDSHVSNLRSVGEEKFKITQAHFPWSVKFKKVIRKGVFSYEWLTNVAKLDQNCLPQKDQFFSRLNSNGITDADYAHAKDVWKTFEMKSMREYHDLYLKTDVLLLADVFENFRDMALEHFKVDPCHYMTAPAMFFDALLKTSDVELELISDPEMYDFVERAKRGEVSSIMKRHAVANNKHMGDRHDPSKPSSYIFYPDANSLYCWPMMQPLPIGGFRWLESSDLEKPLGEFPPCFVSADLEFPEELHDKFKDYPPARDQIKLGGVEKLAPNLLPKTEYVAHIRNIRKYEELGCRITKVHRALAFDEEPWMKTYLERNIEKRKQARNSFEKDF